MNLNENVKYLRVSLCRRLRFRHQIQTVVVKVNATADALGRILPNVGGALAFAYNIEALGGPQRKIALRCIMAYRTVSTVAALVVNGMTPVHLAALESRRRYIKKKQGEIFDEASERNSTVEKLMLTGHGCFRKYLERFKRSESPKFVDCVAEEDDSEYTVFTCDRWWRLRRE
ncbi:Reverse transcriptase domain-containing protein, partial [Aphis craccivora]